MMRMIMMMLKIIMMMGIKDEDEDDIGAGQVPIQLPIFSRLASCKLQVASCNNPIFAAGDEDLVADRSLESSL